MFTRQSGTQECNDVPPEPTLRQYLTDRCADHKRNLDRFENMLNKLPDDILRMKMDEFWKAFGL